MSRNRGSHHNRIGALRPRRTAFDLSYEKKFTCAWGDLIPVMCDEVVPGDHFTIGAQTVIRMQPMAAPILHESNVFVHYFFVPYRLLWEQWENFISGGPDGKFNEPQPRWPVRQDGDLPDKGLFSLWDYLGFPLVTDSSGELRAPWQDVEGNFRPVAWPLRAYNFIWDEYYRDENFQSKAGRSSPEDTAIYPTSVLDTVRNSNGMLRRSWVKDYFTSALPWQLRGDNVAFPLAGTLPVEFQTWPGDTDPALKYQGFVRQQDVSASDHQFLQSSSTVVTGSPSVYPAYIPNVPTGTQFNYQVGPADVDLSEAISFDVSQLRLAVQLQKWMERNARGGVRYTELLRAHFGVFPRDDRLQRPEYIGGVKSPLTVSEVLQTSASVGEDIGGGTDTPQGNMAGHGLLASRNFVGKYFVKEYGLIMGLMSIMATPSYEDGIDRQWLRYTNTDYYWPEFAHLSEQAIFNAEIFASGFPVQEDDPASDDAGWGFQPQYDEMRIKRNMVCSEMRNAANGSLSFWHLGRSFLGLPPLNQNFIQVAPQDPNLMRPFVVRTARPFIVSHANIIKAVRPLPYIGEPGLVDHF